MDVSIKGAAVLATLLGLCVALMFGSVAGCGAVKNYSRHQKFLDAKNHTKITQQGIKTAQQQAQIVAAQDGIVKAQADQRIIKARGLAKAQSIIHSTLTPLYVQLEAVEAQKAIATSGRNNTMIYVPSGTNGTPVLTTSPQDQITGGN